MSKEMKKIIKTVIREFLNENIDSKNKSGIDLVFIKKLLRELITPKTPIGKGKDHVVYDYYGDPSKVIKIAWDNPDASHHQKIWDMNGNVISKDYTKIDPKHISTFINYPDLFPKVFKFTDKYAILEKLDTKKVEEEDRLLSNQLKPYSEGIGEFDGAIFELYTWLTDKWSLRTNKLGNILDKMNESGEDLSLLNKYIEFIRLIIDEIGTVNGKSKYIDVRGVNLGYDTKGNLKLLDF